MIRFFLLFLLFPFYSFSQSIQVTVSGIIRDEQDLPLSYVNISLKKSIDSSFITGTITNEQGRFSINQINTGDYILELSYSGYQKKYLPLVVGRLSAYLDLGVIKLSQDSGQLSEVTIRTIQPGQISASMDKKSFSLGNNISQAGGSVLQAMKDLPGITVNEQNQIELRGSNKVTILVDGKQTALTGFGNQASLDNLPASAIERIEIINNPSSKYDANGAAGIINIIYKKNKNEGFNGKIGLSVGLGALWIKKDNLPSIDPQYQGTPKLNPSASLNYRKNKINIFLQGDWLYNETLNKNDFTSRFYSNGDTIRNQVKRNRITTFASVKTGFDWQADINNTITISGLYSSEYVRDNGDIPYFNNKLTERSRLWQFYEDEVNSAATGTIAYQHKFNQPGHLLNVSFNYTFHREDEKYFLTDVRPTYTGKDTFMLIADEHVLDLNLDYTRPLKTGRIEGGFKFRRRWIPTNMEFFPGLNSPLDTNAAGWAKYSEIIPAVYSNYIYERNKLEVEAGLRIEYVLLDYLVNPDHNTYQSDGYNYMQPFPNLRLGWKINDRNKISLFYIRRVDRPDEVDIRIFPKYDDPEILKVGNPTLRPQFTNSIEAGYKNEHKKGYFYSALYYRTTNGTITRIGTNVPNSSIIYSIFQNAGKSFNHGLEIIIQQNLNRIISFNFNANIYKNRINQFSVQNKYPVPSIYTSTEAKATSGNIKLNTFFRFPKSTDLQLMMNYLAPDIIPQGKIDARFSVDAGIKKIIQKGKGELYFNSTDLLNTLKIKKNITGTGFKYESIDYYETQVFRLGYSFKF